MSYSSSSASPDSRRYSQISQDYFFQPVPQADAGVHPSTPGNHPLRDLPQRHRPNPLPLKSSTFYDAPSQSKEYLLDTASSHRSSLPYSPFTHSRTPSGASKSYDDPPSSAMQLLLPPSGTPKSAYQRSSTYVGKRPPASGWYAYFEATDWKSIIIHTVAVACAYPFLILMCLLASNKTLFWSRVIVGFGCGILAFALGRTPFGAARRYLEASSALTCVIFILFYSLLTTLKFQHGRPSFTRALPAREMDCRLVSSRKGQRTRWVRSRYSSCCIGGISPKRRPRESDMSAFRLIYYFYVKLI